MEKISPKSVKDIEKSRFWSRSRDFCQILYDFGFGFKKLVSEKSIGFGFGKFGIGKEVSVSVSEFLVSEKSIGFGFGKIWYRKKVSVLVSESLVSEKKSRYRFRKIWYRKKSLGIGFGQNFGIVIQCLEILKKTACISRALDFINF